MLVNFECPNCHGSLCEIWGLDGSSAGIRLSYWFYNLNPGIAVNELVFGQRMPKRTYVCKSCPRPLAERSFVHCPLCDTFHDSRVWALPRAFGNWLGLVCPTCGAEIPCSWNLTSQLLLALTMPLWFLPVKHNRAKWLSSKHRLIAGTAHKLALARSQPDREKKSIDYLCMGLGWGLAMFLIMTPFTTHRWWWEMSLPFLLVNMAVWTVGGIVFGVAMKIFMDKSGDPALHLDMKDLLERHSASSPSDSLLNAEHLTDAEKESG